MTNIPSFMMTSIFSTATFRMFSSGRQIGRARELYFGLEWIRNLAAAANPLEDIRNVAVEKMEVIMKEGMFVKGGKD